MDTEKNASLGASRDEMDLSIIFYKSNSVKKWEE